jgi:hypothetical protein
MSLSDPNDFGNRVNIADTRGKIAILLIRVINTPSSSSLLFSVALSKYFRNASAGLTYYMNRNTDFEA